jgi:hypothetical protein
VTVASGNSDQWWLWPVVTVTSGTVTRWWLCLWVRTVFSSSFCIGNYNFERRFQVLFVFRKRTLLLYFTLRNSVSSLCVGIGVLDILFCLSCAIVARVTSQQKFSWLCKRANALTFSSKVAPSWKSVIFCRELKCYYTEHITSTPAVPLTSIHHCRDRIIR